MLGIKISSKIKKQSNVEYYLSNAMIDLDSYKASYNEYIENNRDTADLMAVVWNIIDLMYPELFADNRSKRYDKVDRITNYR